MARFNPWIEATIASGPVIDVVLNERPQLMDNFDLVHFTCPYASKTWLPRFRDRLPVVTSHHHVTDWEAIKHNTDGDAIIVGSPEWAEDLFTRGVDAERVFCVPYGVDADLFQPATDEQRRGARASLQIADNATVIGFFGKNSSNDDDRKGIDVFTRALIQLRQKLPLVTALIVGPGWKTLIENLTANGVRCVWKPFIKELRDLSKMYHALDFYWVTARIEGGPVTLLEAMSSEVVSLTTRVGIAKEIARDGENAVVLPFDDSMAFAERSAELVHNIDERKRMAANGRETILREMDTAVTSKRVKEVYRHAFKNFDLRKPQHSVPEKLHRWDFNKDVTRESTQTEIVPLNGIPPEMHRRIRMLEALAWSEHLVLYHKQRLTALKLISREWLQNPSSIEPARVMLRRFLPVSLVGAIVNAKHRLQGTGGAGNYSASARV